MKKLFGLLMTAVMFGGILLSCSLDLGDDNNSGTGTGEWDGVDYTNHSSDYALVVSNTTSRNLVAFKGGLSSDRLIGGIPAGEKNWHLKKGTLFPATGDFTLILLTLEDYKANKSNLRALENTPFTRAWAFYNANGEGNDTVIEISDKLGGDNRLVIQNNTSMNVELRLDGIHGPTIGYAMDRTQNTTLSMSTGNYSIFPVFKKYDAVHDRVITVYPTIQEGDFAGSPWSEDYGFSGGKEITIDVSQITTKQEFTTGCAYLAVVNGSSSGFSVYKGNMVQKTETGISTINGGETRTFRIDMAKIGSKYAETATFAGLSMGPAGRTSLVDEKLVDTDGQPVTNFMVNVDTIYQITVTGTVNQGTFKMTW
ncbi:MAG: hypothetical protein LBH75_03160, partial [Treponema sp.]|nr:hypothetical protein [Treponema sp.]